MAVPTSYTDTEFKAYLDTELGAVADALSWTTGAGDYDEALNDALNMFDASDIADVSGASNIDKFRLFGKLAIWRRVVAQTSADINFAADGGSYSRSQFNAQAEKQVKDLERRLVADLYPAEVQDVSYIQDPYEYQADEDRTL